MKTILSSMAAAFSMYSKIPMPYKGIYDRGMKYALCFFPLVGAAAGFLELLWLSTAYFLGVNYIIKAAVLCIIPTLVTGGIHMDGFLDTIDALSSHKSKEEKLEILKDPHTGSFAIIYGCVYYILYFALWTQLSLKAEIILAVGFILSRALSALAAALFKKAKKSGLLYAFADEADRKAVIVSSVIYIVICVCAMLFINWKTAVFVIAGALCAFTVYRAVSYRQFGGITGDLAGYFVCLCELFMAAFACAGELIWCL